MDVGKMLCALLQFAYEDGLKGVAGYPLDVKAETVAAEEVTGKQLNHREIKRMVKCVNRAYKRGRAERIKA